MTEKSQSSTVIDSTTAEPKHKGNINLHQQNVTSFKKGLTKYRDVSHCSDPKFSNSLVHASDIDIIALCW